MLRKLVCLLLGVEHHLLISPLSELSVGIEKRAGGRDLTLLRWMDWVWLLVRVLIKGGGIEGLCVGIPTCLLLLDGVGIMRTLWGRNLGGRRRGIGGRRHALAGNRWVGWVGGRRIHCVMIFGRVPILGDENCHGLGKRDGGKKGKEKKERERERRE
jgi:hypothetical protein